MSKKNIDDNFPETQDTIVKSSRSLYRYRKRFKKGDESKGRKQSRFWMRDKTLRATDPTARRD